MNPVFLEVLRYRLDAVCEEAGLTIERTAISPVVVESKDYGVMLCDANGRLITGAGVTRTHFFAAENSVQATIERHGDTVRPGDVFIANDPHNGGGLHPQDVFVLSPVYHQNKLCAWVATTAHMMDMGGMVPGSFAPGATECYQEAFRFPPVLVIRDGQEQKDVWSIFLNNVRMAGLIDIDLRGLIAGCHIATNELASVVASCDSVDHFQQAIDALCNLSEVGFRSRMSHLEDGVYTAISWNEWNEETYVVPCTLTIEEGHLHFDFEGASPQAPRFFNSKPFIVKSELGVEIANLLGQDLPYNGGLFKTFDIHCPEKSILNCEPPAPVGFGHVEVSFNAVEVATRALMAAIAASPNSEARKYLSNSITGSCAALHTWAGMGLAGIPDAWLMFDGATTGAGGAHDRDGNDLFGWMVSDGGALEVPDIEVLESWYPIQMTHRKLRSMVDGEGAGCFRAGAGGEAVYEISGTDALIGTIFTNRCRVPLLGSAGGYPGACTQVGIQSSDGEFRRIQDHEQGYQLLPGEKFLVKVATSGGYGDPLDREPSAVEADLHSGRISAETAEKIYGVLPGDAAATLTRRDKMRSDRLANALPALRPMGDAVPVNPSESRPLSAGILQQGNLAVSELSGAVLAQAPNHWTDGCPQLWNFIPADESVDVIGYLDPINGRMLFVDVVVKGTERSFTTMPKVWTDAA